MRTHSVKPTISRIASAGSQPAPKTLEGRLVDEHTHGHRPLGDLDGLRNRQDAALRGEQQETEKAGDADFAEAS